MGNHSACSLILLAAASQFMIYEHPQACRPDAKVTRRKSENGPHSRLLIHWPTTVHKINRTSPYQASTSSSRPPSKLLDVQSSSDITSRPRPYHGSFEGKAQFFTTPSPRSWILAREPSHESFAGSGDHLRAKSTHAADIRGHGWTGFP